MTEEEQRQEVAVWGEDIGLRNKDCSLEKTDEDMYYNSKWEKHGFAEYRRLQ